MAVNAISTSSKTSQRIPRNESVVGLTVTDSNIFDTVVDALQHREETVNFGTWTYVSTGLAAFFYVLDIYTDTFNAVSLFKSDHVYWFSWTVFYALFPMVIANMFSIYWYWHDDHECEKVGHVVGTVNTKASKTEWTLRILVHILLLGPLLRSFEVLLYGSKSKHCQTTYSSQPLKCTTYYVMYVSEIRDVSMLALVHTFLGDAPQSMLQLYIMNLSDEEFTRSVVGNQAVAVVSSLVSIAWTLASYQKALRVSLFEKKNLNWWGLMCQVLWRLGTISSRIISFALFASKYKLWSIVIMACHWMIMMSWTVCQNTDFCQDEQGNGKYWMEKMYNAITSFISITCFFNVKDDATRLKNLIYYTLVLSENSVMILLWYFYTDDTWYHLPALVVVFASFFVGIFFMLVYYRFLHPSGTMPDFSQEARIC